VPVDPEKPTESAGQTDEPPVRPFPACPNCGWHNVRLSQTKTMVDTVLNSVSVQRFKCRSCGHYFRRWFRLEE
jgi:hypothetical protein